MNQATLADLIIDTRERLNETEAAFWSEDVMARWIWEAARDIARRTEWNKKTRYFDIVADQQAYELPDDWFRIHRLEYRQSTGNSWALEWQEFSYMDDIWLSSRETSGQPQWWTLWGDEDGAQKLHLYPRPSDSITQGLLMYYYAVPKRVNTDDFNAIVEVPQGWDDLIPLYVEVVARRKEARDSRWQEAQMLYEQKLAEFMKVSRHPTDQENFVSAGGLFGGTPGWLTDGDGW